MSENPHAGCDPDARAYTEQTCDRCRRTLIVTPSDDFYCADGSPDHVCEKCLTGGIPVTVRIHILADDDE